MGQYFKAYSPARKSVADITYSQNFDSDCLRNVPDYSPKEISRMFDEVELKMGAEFGEYCLVGDYGTIVYRTGDEQNPSYQIGSKNPSVRRSVWTY